MPVGLFIDPLYLLLFIVTLAISGGAQLYIRSTFSRWNQVPNSAGLAGADVGERLVRGPAFARGGGTGAGVTFKLVPGDLSDHFDPRTREVGLSRDVATRPSVAAMAVTAHEVGHAQQHAEGTFAMQARSFLVPAVTFSPIVSYLFIFLGLILNIAGLFWLGIIAFALMVVFTLLTLPVEIGASRRALVMLRDTGLLAGRDEEGARKVLIAAALTYVAAAVTAVLTLLYYLSLARR
jgi:Zn-dependent membrane protease YugP